MKLSAMKLAVISFVFLLTAVRAHTSCAPQTMLLFLVKQIMSKSRLASDRHFEKVLLRKMGAT